MAYKNYTVQSWTNTPQYETMEYENEEGDMVSEEVEISHITYNEDERFYGIDDAIAHYDSLDLSSGGAIIFYIINVEGGYKTFRHSHLTFPSGHEEDILNEINGG